MEPALTQHEHKVARLQLAEDSEDDNDDKSNEDGNENAGEPVDSDLLVDLPDTTPEIDLNHARLSTLANLRLPRFAQHLNRLCLRKNAVAEISEADVGALINLEELDLYDNQVKTVGNALATTPLLRILDLSYNVFRTLPQELGHLGQLDTLYLVQNKITRIDPSHNLPVSLRSLELGGNRIRAIAHLESLVNLEELWLGKNKITKLEGLTTLVKLRRLSVQSNRITKIEGLDALINLEELYLSHNGLKKLEGLEQNVKLTTLDVSNNEIGAIENLAHLTNMSDLWASYNKIPDLKALESQLGKHADLETIYLERNPCERNDQGGYRRKIMLALPQVKQIDATYVRQ